MRERMRTPREQILEAYAVKYGKLPESSRPMLTKGGVTVYFIQSDGCTTWATKTSTTPGEIRFWDGLNFSISAVVKLHQEFYGIDPEETEE